MNKIALALFIFSLIALTQAQTSTRCPHNCNNNGQCVRTTPFQGSGPVYICRCGPKWTGPACGKSVICIPKCKNGGLCRSNENGNPVCRCSSGYTGIDCGTLINRCSNNPCADAATDRCVPVLEGYVCVPRNSAGGCVSTALEIKCKLS